MASSNILLSSAYRNRLLYPNPADFIVPFQIQNNAPRLNVLNTMNPISVFPVYNFCWTNYQNTNQDIFTTTIIGGGGSFIKVPFDDVCKGLLGISSDQGYLRQDIKNCQNILNNFNIRIIIKGIPYVTAIVSFSPIYSIIETLEVIPFTIGDKIEIVNPSVLIDENNNQSKILVNGDLREKLINFNTEIFLYNITLNEVKPAYFDTNSNTLNTQSAFSSTISYTDKYLFFNKNSPMSIGNLEKFPNNKYYIENCLHDFSMLHKGFGYHKSEKVYLIEKGSPSIEEYSFHSILHIEKIDEYGGILQMNLAELGSQNFQRSTYYKVIPIHKRESLDFCILFVDNVSTAFRCKPKAQMTPLDLKGNYFSPFLLSPLYTSAYFQTTMDIYNSPNNVFPVQITKDEPIDSLLTSQELNGVFGIKKTIISEKNEIILFVQKISQSLLDRFDRYEALPPQIKSSTQFKDAIHFCVYPFLNEGVVSLNFTGSHYTQSQMCCYEMTVLNLILPNREIDSLDSLLTSGYPYVLLEISNVSQPNARNKNAIYSNNPSAVNSTFVCAISDVNNPLTTKFIKISSDGSVQTLKFSPMDDLKVRVLLPSGDPLVYVQNDNLPPSFVNPFLQLNIFLEIKKL